MNLRDHTNSISRAARWAVLLSLVLLPLIAAHPVEAQMRRETLTLQSSAGRQPIEIEIADTLEEKSRGLMFRPKIPEATGMLFPYGTPQEITMWMKNTYASLDMVFIRADGTVHRIETGTEPMSEKVIASEGPVVAVLELAAGAAAKYGLKAGDKVLHKTFGTAN
jgi:uncharacterized membrane protein (UPF0127 family)